MTAPVIAKEEPTAYTDPFDDVFGSAPASPTLSDRGFPPHLQSVDPSDIPRLRSTHVTNGYREGIAASKESFVQVGFDEGYPLGAELGMARGWCLGVLEGLIEALVEKPDVSASSSITTSQQNASDGGLVTRGQVQTMFHEAEEELHTQKLLDKEYFGEDGIWTYDVPGQDLEGDVTFREVAAAHPMIKKWTAFVFDLAKHLGLELLR